MPGYYESMLARLASRGRFIAIRKVGDDMFIAREERPHPFMQSVIFKIKVYTGTAARRMFQCIPFKDVLMKFLKLLF